MKNAIKMPKMGESITSGTITQWFKKVGDFVEIDEPLFDLATDKVSSEIPSPFEGVLSEILFSEGSTVDVGIVLAYISDEKEVIPSIQVSSQEKTPIKSLSPKKTLQSNQKTLQSKTFFTPLVRALAKKNRVDLDLIKTEKLRFTKKDFLDFLSTKNIPSDHQTVITLDPIRKIIAKNTVLSKQISPHVYSYSEVDLSALVKFREENKQMIKEKYGFNLTYVPFILRALGLALKDFPRINASLKEDQLTIHPTVNLGLAISLGEKGLIVPVIKDITSLTFLNLCFEIQRLTLKARNNELKLQDLENGTFTYSNVGSFGSLMTFPIIVQPQLAIYGSGIIQKKVVVENHDQIAIRSIMSGTLSYDHRVVDGEMGIKFLEKIHEYLKIVPTQEIFSS